MGMFPYLKSKTENMAFEKDYYTLVASLPEISWDERKLPLTVQEFRDEAKEYISGKDAEL